MNEPFSSTLAIGPAARSAVGNPYLFQGARQDAETGFYYFRNRSYDAATGRFLQRDPVWDEQNVGGWYTFTGNSPMSRRDPLGLGDEEERLKREIEKIDKELEAARGATDAGKKVRELQKKQAELSRQLTKLGEKANKKAGAGCPTPVGSPEAFGLKLPSRLQDLYDAFEADLLSQAAFRLGQNQSALEANKSALAAAKGEGDELERTEALEKEREALEQQREALTKERDEALEQVKAAREYVESRVRGERSCPISAERSRIAFGFTELGRFLDADTEKHNINATQARNLKKFLSHARETLFKEAGD